MDKSMYRVLLALLGLLVCGVFWCAWELHRGNALYVREHFPLEYSAIRL